MSKLSKYGVRHSAQLWIRSYLQDRTQVTKVGQAVSSPLPVVCGVPQGSILGPVLFTIYINDLPHVIPSSKCNLYTDDTAITVVGDTGNDIKCKLSEVVESVQPWFTFNRLSMNCDKTQFMVFGTKQKCKKVMFDQVTINNSNISRAMKIKYLGIQLDPNLTFSEHVDYVKKKTIGKIKLLGRLNMVLSQETMLHLYKTLIMPIIDYGDVIYNCMSQKDANILQRLQNMAFKNILRVPRLTSTDEIHRDLDMLMLHERRTLHTATQMFKVEHKLCPAAVTALFVKRSDIHRTSTRQACKNSYNIPKLNLEMSKRNFTYRGVMIWESLPGNLKLAATYDEFKLNVIRWLKDGDNAVT